MKLHAIKNEILEILNNITLDDLYSTSVNDLVGCKLVEHEGSVSEKEIEKHLFSRFLETSPEMLQYNTNLEISSINEQIEEIKKAQKDAAGTLLEITDHISRRQRELSDSVTKAEKLRNQILEIESEIAIILPLAMKYPYRRELEDLRDQQDEMTLKLKENAEHQQKLEESIRDYGSKGQLEHELIAKLESTIEPKSLLIVKCKQDLDEKIKINKNYFDLEYDALAFLYKLFLRKNIKKRAAEALTKTGKIIKDHRGHHKEEELYLKTGEISLVMDKIEDQQYFQFLISLVNAKSVIPENWRTILLDILDEPLPNLAGIIVRLKTLDEISLVQKSLPLQSVDTATFLALIIALNHNYSLKTTTGDIILGMSGGISAKINIRIKGELIRKVFDDQLKIFSNCTYSERFKLQTLYEQTGYANSSVEIATPGAYTIFNGNFAIDIHFSPAPILFDNHALVKFVPNISGIAKEEYDEMMEQDY